MRIQVLLTAAVFFASVLAASGAFAREALTNIDGMTVHEDALDPGETLSRLFTREGISREEGELFVRTLRRHLNLRRMAAGQTVILYLSVPPVRDFALHAVAIPLRRDRSVVAVREGDSDRVRGGVYGNEEAADWIEAAVGTGTETARPGSARLELRQGDNLVMALLRAGATRDDAHRAATGLRHHVNLRRLAIGEPIDVEFSTSAGQAVLEAVALPNRGGSANLRRDAFGVFRPSADVAAGVLQPPPPPVEPPPTAASGQADEFAALGDRLVARGTGNRFDDTFERGDTLEHRLQRAGMSLTEIRGAVRAFAKEMRPTAILAGQRFAYGMDGGSVTYFAVADRRRKAVLVARTATGEWTAQRIDWLDVGVAAEKLAGRAWPRDLENQQAAVQAQRLQRVLEQTRLRSGDVLLSVLTGLGERRAHAHAAATAFGTIARLDRLQPGQKLIFPRAAADLPLAGFFLETAAKRRRGVLVLRDTRGATKPPGRIRPTRKRSSRRWIRSPSRYSRPT